MFSWDEEEEEEVEILEFDLKNTYWEIDILTGNGNYLKHSL